MDDDEYKLLQFYSPFAIASLTEKDKDFISRLLGFRNVKDCVMSASQDKNMIEAMSLLSLLHSFSDDRASLKKFFNNLIFTDKELETKVRRTYNIVDKDALSSSALQAMWELEYDGDED
tara:strand:+ start:270 stop:626 length:357 start_codon:yes stop_codon:yes gene_type:complete